VAGGGQFVDGGVEGRLAAGDQGDGGAGLGEGAGDRAAQAGRGAGDEDGSAAPRGRILDFGFWVWDFV